MRLSLRKEFVMSNHERRLELIQELDLRFEVGSISREEWKMLRHMYGAPVRESNVLDASSEPA
jgi:hypothetical protein